MKNKNLVLILGLVISCIIIIVLYFLFKREGSYEEYLGTTTPLSQLDIISLPNRNDGKDTYEEDLKTGQIRYDNYKNTFMTMYKASDITFKSDEVDLDTIEYKSELCINPDYDDAVNYCAMVYTNYWLTDYPIAVEFVKEDDLMCYYLVTFTNDKIKVYVDLFDELIYGFVFKE